MSQAVKRPMTVAEFLAWEERQELRYEFDGVDVHAMTGGTLAHAAICRNVVTALTNRLRGKRCQPYGENLKVQVAGAIRYPDALVTCTPGPPRSTVATAPVVLFEVLSPSTAAIAFTDKHDEYRDTPSVQRYVILAQDRIHATVFARAGGQWTRAVRTAGKTLEMPEIGIAVPLAEVYEDVAFEPG